VPRRSRFRDPTTPTTPRRAASSGRAARRGVSHDREDILPSRPHVTALAAAGAAIVLGAGAALALAATQDRDADERRVAELRTTARDLRTQLQRERAESQRALRQLRHQVIARPSVEHAIRLGAAAYGQSPERLRRIALCESLLDPDAASGPYMGLFQFGTPLWGRTPFAGFDRSDPYASAFAASWAFARGWDAHWPACGRS